MPSLHRTLALLGAISSTACAGDPSAPSPAPATLRYDLVFERVDPPRSDVYVLRDRADFAVPLIEDGGLSGSPTLSADGQRLVYVGSGLGTDPQDLWVANSDGSAPRRIPLRAGTEFSPSLSPAGHAVAFIRIDAQDRAHLLKVDVDGAFEIEMAEEGIAGERINATPAWSPDGERIAYAAGPPGRLDLWVVGLDGRNRRRLTEEEGSAFDPAWSPDGRRIAYVRSTSHSASDLVILDVQTGARRALGLAGANRHPLWSPAGDRLVFSSTLDGGPDTDLFSIGIDGQSLQRITDTPQSERRPSWRLRR